MELTLVNTYTDKEITVKNVIAYEIKEDGTRIYIEQNGRKDMTTCPNYFPKLTLQEQLKDFVL